MYRQIVDRIFARVVALKDQYPHLTSMGTATRKDEAADKLWLVYHFTHGLSFAPNPSYSPGNKSARTLKSFAGREG